MDCSRLRVCGRGCVRIGAATTVFETAGERRHHPRIRAATQRRNANTELTSGKQRARHHFVRRSRPISGTLVTGALKQLLHRKGDVPARAASVTFGRRQPAHGPIPALRLYLRKPIAAAPVIALLGAQPKLGCPSSQADKHRSLASGSGSKRVFGRGTAKRFMGGSQGRSNRRVVHFQLSSYPLAQTMQSAQ